MRARARVRVGIRVEGPLSNTGRAFTSKFGNGELS
jgi:hypothetical protein